jgi:hypothetical protein
MIKPDPELSKIVGVVWQSQERALSAIARPKKALTRFKHAPSQDNRAEMERLRGEMYEAIAEAETLVDFAIAALNKEPGE